MSKTDTKPLAPAILTIFGVTGDLAKRKLLPALYYLAHAQRLPEAFKIVGITRQNTTVNSLIADIKAGVEAGGGHCEPTTLTWLKQAILIVKLDITKPADYAQLKSELDTLEDGTGVCFHRLFYLAIPSTLFGTVAQRLGQHDLSHGCQHGSTESRLLIEKPFGYDLASAESLVKELQSSFSEKNIYRIDHYLAKETVQNILTFRFENPLFSGSWDKHHIDHILITAAESIGIEGRVGFYEQMGALRDLFQSHLLQILALTTMERPRAMSARDIHEAKEALLRNVKPPRADEMQTRAIRGQYATYHAEVGGHRTHTETYAAIQLSIDEERWEDVPVFIRTGKALAEKVTEITVIFRDPDEKACSNSLTLRIQPNEGIVLDLRIKKPGFEHAIEHVQMDFCYGGAIDAAHPDAYERVLVDTMRGDKTLFATSEEVLASWRVTEPILKAWETARCPLHIYENGSWGPSAADELPERAGAKWLTDILRICTVRPSFHNEKETSNER